MRLITLFIIFGKFTGLSKAKVANQPGGAQQNAGIGIVSFLSALGSASIFFLIQLAAFLFLRNKLDRIFKPKTYLAPRTERTQPPPPGLGHLIKELWEISDGEVICKCGLDAYFFLRYLKILIVIFFPIACLTLSILVPLNYIGGRGRALDDSSGDIRAPVNEQVTGLDVLAWGNVKGRNIDRYWAHLVVSVLSVAWVIFVLSMEMRAYVTVRHDYLVSAAHQSKISATTVLVRSIPQNWRCEKLLRDVFSVYPGGVKQVWMNHDLSPIIRKIALRKAVHLKLESAETYLIKAACEKAIKQGKLGKRLKKVANGSRKRQTRKNDTGICHPGGQGSGTSSTLSPPWAIWEKQLRYGPDAVSSMPQIDLPNRGGAGSSETRSPKQKPISRTDLDLNVRGAITTAGGQIKRRALTTNGFAPLETLAETEEDVHSELPIASRGSLGRERMNPSVSMVHAQTCDRDYAPSEKSWWRVWKSPPSTAYSMADDVSSRHGIPAMAWYSGLRLQKKADFGTHYREATTASYADNWKKGVWREYLDLKARPTFRLPFFGIRWLPGFPLISQSVDTIGWCRKELARLNVEIDEDRKHEENFPRLDSAFIQFNTQIAAHMACQNKIYCRPGYMTISVVETSPEDIVWENMGIGYREGLFRSLLVTSVLTLMISLWSVPVAWSGVLGQVDSLIDSYSWLSFVRETPELRASIQAISGLLPTAMLTVMLLLLPPFLNRLANLKGICMHSERSQFVQKYYFIFLFIQVFLVVSIASFFTTSVTQLASNVKTLQKVSDLLSLLATNLPKAANYFYSYMLLQSLSASSATLLQVGTLITWYLVSPLVDFTARQKWTRVTELCPANLGALFPVYTNFACIGLIYCTISPLISVFAILTFSLFWIAQRYMLLYVNRFEYDTGGKLYPRAINQTFTGLYTMELCVSGLFFTIRDEDGEFGCRGHGVIMLCLLLITVFCQVRLNLDCLMLSRFLPVMTPERTLEETVEAINFSDRLGDGSIGGRSRTHRYRQREDRNNLMANAFYSGSVYNTARPAVRSKDEVDHGAFQHEALRTSDPIIWIPKDSFGISEDEIRQTTELSEHIGISNRGAVLDKKAEVKYGGNPPDL